MTQAAALMLVSAAADARLRRDVADGVRPRPEYLVLESEHGVDLLDWTLVPGPSRRTAVKIAAHAAAALQRLRGYSVVFADGEHVGIPLAAALRATGATIPLLVIGHHLTTSRKVALLRRLRVHRRMTRILFHSSRQRQLAMSELGMPASQLALVPYYADTNFWRPGSWDEEALVVTAGREHRDFATLAEACAGLPVKVFAAIGSVHSPAATSTAPKEWPANFDRGFAGYRTLRELYARASVVVVPLVETDFQAGVTTILEAAAMGKAVVATATSGQSDTIVDGETGILVPPGDPTALRDTIRGLLANPAERRRLGLAAHDAVRTYGTVEAYAATLARHLDDISLTRLQEKVG